MVSPKSSLVHDIADHWLWIIVKTIWARVTIQPSHSTLCHADDINDSPDAISLHRIDYQPCHNNQNNQTHDAENVIKFTFNILLFSAFAFKVFIPKKHESYSTTQLTLASTWGWWWSVMVTSQHYLTIISRTWQMCRSFYPVSLSVVRVSSVTVFCSAAPRLTPGCRTPVQAWRCMMEHDDGTLETSLMPPLSWRCLNPQSQDSVTKIVFLLTCDDDHDNSEVEDEDDDNSEDDNLTNLTIA